MANLISLAAIVFTGLLIYHFRVAILTPLRRFEARNKARRIEELRALFDGTAHYRETMALAGEQIEGIEKITVSDTRTAQNVARYLFQGVEYATLAEAEAARLAEITALARDFYIDLDRNFLSRRRPPAAALPSLPDAGKQ